jgi:DNA-binding response OmpR family regulator
MRVLAVDDDANLREMLRLILARDGHTVVLASDGRTARDLLATSPFDVVVLDWSMPGLDGVETCRRLRATSSTPVMMLTARMAESDKVVALDAGADDFVTKPFGARELVARLRALVRRSRVEEPSRTRVVVGDLSIDLHACTVDVGNRTVDVTPNELRLLVALAGTPGQVRQVRDIAREVGWGDGPDQELQAIVKTNVRRLRRKIEEDPNAPRRVVSHRGYGYALAPMVARAS